MYTTLHDSNASASPLAAAGTAGQMDQNEQ
jgi:hypothetical protein